MATLDQAKNARDRIADAILDGQAVHSVGIESDHDDYSVGITASRPVKLPDMPGELSEVDVHVVIVGGRVSAHTGGANRVAEFLRSFMSRSA